MSTRYTKRDAEQAARVLAGRLGKPWGHYRKVEQGEVSNLGEGREITTIPGGWALSQAYGGYEIQELGPEPGDTWVRTPIWSGHVSAREAYTRCWAAIRALECAEAAEVQA